MTNLKLMSDDNLLSETQKLVQKEREILSDVLHHFREIERRRLFSKLKFGSLYDYATKELGYSADQAYRRIQAMRLLKDMPELEEKINDGSLSLSHLGMAHSLFKREEKSGKPISKQGKIEVLEKLENTSKREAEKITFSMSLAPVEPIEKIRSVSKDQVEVKFIADEKLIEKIKKMKGLLSNRYPNLRTADLVDLLCDLGIEKWDKTAPARDTKRQDSKAQIKRSVWARDKGQCQVCKSQYHLEIDHIRPKALSGEDSFENLRLLCRPCNQRKAIEVFGISKMEKYLIHK